MSNGNRRLKEAGLGVEGTKYLTKQFFVAVPSKKKRISTSRGIRLFQKRESSGWWWDRKHIKTFYDFAVTKSRQRIMNVHHDDGGLKSFESAEPPEPTTYHGDLLPFDDSDLEDPVRRRL